MPLHIPIPCIPKKHKQQNKDGQLSGDVERWQEEPPASPLPPSLLDNTPARHYPQNYTALAEIALSTHTPNIAAYAAAIEENLTSDPWANTAQTDEERLPTIRRRTEHRKSAAPDVLLSRKKSLASASQLNNNADEPPSATSPHETFSTVTNKPSSRRMTRRGIDSELPPAAYEPPVVEGWKDQPPPSIENLQQKNSPRKFTRLQSEIALANARRDMYQRTYSAAVDPAGKLRAQKYLTSISRKNSTKNLGVKKSTSKNAKLFKKKSSNIKTAQSPPKITVATHRNSVLHSGRVDMYQRKFADSQFRPKITSKQATLPSKQFTLSQMELNAKLDKSQENVSVVQAPRKSMAARKSRSKSVINAEQQQDILAVEPVPVRGKSFSVKKSLVAEPTTAVEPQEVPKKQPSKLKVKKAVVPPADAAALNVKRRKLTTVSEKALGPHRNTDEAAGDGKSNRKPKQHNNKLAIAPLTRRSGDRPAGSLVYHYPSFSGRSSADCEHIALRGAKKHPFDTPLTRAIFAHQGHSDLIDQVNAATGGAQNYRTDQELETIYGMRVKKFWDRYQLHGTPYLDHLRHDPHYKLMPPHARTKLQALHARNEHLCQHLYHIKMHPTTFLDNRTPHSFGQLINVEAQQRAKTWRLRTEINYKLFLNIMRCVSLSVSADELLREGIRRLKCQMFLARQPATSIRFKKTLENCERSLNDPNYARNGPSWWRTLTPKENDVLKNLLQAANDDDDETFCSTMRRLGLQFEQFHLQEALDMCNTGRGASSSGDVDDALELLYYLRMTTPVRAGPYKLRSFLFVGIVNNTPSAQIDDVRETMKECFNWHEINKLKIIERKKFAKKFPNSLSRHVYERLRDIRDAMKIYSYSPYGQINIRWLTNGNKKSLMARTYTKTPGPYDVQRNVARFKQWALDKHYIITKLPDFGRLPMFQRYYVKALDKFRPPERVFLNVH